MPDTGPQQDRVQLLRAARSGDEAARRTLLGLCYTELRRLAHRLLRSDVAPHLRPSEIVHEAAQRVLDVDRMEWRERAHFLATAAAMMRQALVDEVRRYRATRQATPPVTTTMDESGEGVAPLDLEQFDAALRELQAIDAERARLVELRVFAGLTVEEAAEVLEFSPVTIRRRWDVSRAWLLRRLAAVP
ncbi:MAG: ECF-type sigma factor [Steroidobacteraceae bacterium]|jgi:RNA polymerase sigma factor (TIGR02999 family)|nr:ECF-type sigma factor [Steroidobacteraceae bacterium]